MDEIRDEQLVDYFRESGEIRHFNELVIRHIGKVRAMIYPMVLNNADADELTQEVFLRVVKGISEFRGKSRFSSWLYRITINTVYSFLRKRSNRPAEHYAEPPEQPNDSSDPADTLMSGETDAGITNALASLSPILRSAITLTALHGMSVREAARAEDCLTATMYWRVHEARRILKKKLDKDSTADCTDRTDRKKL